MEDISPPIDQSAEDAVATERPPESRARRLWPDVRHGGALIKKYVKNDPIVGPLLFAVELASGALTSVVFMQMQVHLAAITNALVARDAGVIGGYVSKILFAGVLMAVVGTFVQWSRFTLRIRMRRVLTDSLIARWMSANRFFHLEQRERLDYPEQRIQDDVFQFIERLTTLAPGILFALFSIFLYTGQLWKLSPPVVFSSIGMTHTIPGYLVYLAFAFAILWTILTHVVGKSLTRVEVVRQRLEAQFRQQMGAVRENGEAIAFARAAPIEEARLHDTFELIRHNWQSYIFANLKITVVMGVPQTVLIVAPTLLCAPYVLSGQMQIGDIALVGASFMQVFNGVGIVITQYADLAVLRSAVARLRLLDEMLEEHFANGIAVREGGEGAISVGDLVIDYPNGQAMMDVGNLQIKPGNRLLVQGRSGSGKSTMLRSIAGLWPYGSGHISMPDHAAIAFLPQRAYMPEGTLASLLSYPQPSEAYKYEEYATLLSRLGLDRLVPRLHETQPWGRILSPGEQQRVAAARVILSKPDFLFVDEATSALDATSEAQLYGLLLERLPKVALISVAHKESVEQYHDTVLRLEDGRASTSALRRAEDESQ
ncbi:ABC transporter ATP-binding protein/permease [Sphingobium lactosutens]|uniref:ABC transporter ATP-binding protein/permease n=1 Tax=Sphingobium lactosutens TaxID=522773 RepID=UPI001C4CCF3B|nr:SbmA/BacA-like family transporter [Sphingobium lactosutens]